MKKNLPILLLTLMLAACGSDQDDLDLWMQQQGRGLAGKVEPIPQLSTAATVEYTGFGLLSPFDAARLKVAGSQNSANAPDLKRPRDPLENYSIESLKMVGRIQIKGVHRGLIQTPDGMVYPVRAGSFVGTNFGVVAAVLDTEIKLTETVEDVNGDWVKRETNILLADEQGQKK
jgi:type IV pilus assembly protein PilP